MLQEPQERPLLKVDAPTPHVGVERPDASYRISKYRDHRRVTPVRPHRHRRERVVGRENRCAARRWRRWWRCSWAPATSFEEDRVAGSGCRCDTASVAACAGRRPIQQGVLEAHEQIAASVAHRFHAAVLAKQRARRGSRGAPAAQHCVYAEPTAFHDVQVDESLSGEGARHV
eukprot:1375302-Prymnesium_polylepis.2